MAFSRGPRARSNWPSNFYLSSSESAPLRVQRIPEGRGPAKPEERLHPMLGRSKADIAADIAQAHALWAAQGKRPVVKKVAAERADVRAHIAPHKLSLNCDRYRYFTK
jgi:hypothetical protein